MPEREDISMHIDAGWEYDTAGRHTEALLEWRAALKDNPENASLYYGMGCALGKIGRIAEAVSYFREAVRIQPNHVDARYGVILNRDRLLRGSHNKADLRDLQDLCREVLLLNSLKPLYTAAVHQILSGTQWRLGERKAAMETIRMAVEADPDIATHYLILSRMQAMMFDPVGSFRTFHKYAEHPGYDPSTCVPCAECKRKLTAFALLVFGGVLLIRHAYGKR